MANQQNIIPDEDIFVGTLGREMMEENLIRQNSIVGKLRTVHNIHPRGCPGFSYGNDLIIQNLAAIPFSFYHFDIASLLSIPGEHFIVGCINFATPLGVPRGTLRKMDIQFMVTGKIEEPDFEIEGQERIEENARVREIEEEISRDCLGFLGVQKNNVDMKKQPMYNEGNPIGISREKYRILDSIVESQGRTITSGDGRGAVGSYIHINTLQNAIEFLLRLGNTRGHTDKSIIGICVVNVDAMRQQIFELVRPSLYLPPDDRRIIQEVRRRWAVQNGNSPMRRIKSKSSSCRDCKLYLSQFLVKDLKKIAKQFDCKNSSNMTKSELIKYILAHHKK